MAEGLEDVFDALSCTHGSPAPKCESCELERLIEEQRSDSKSCSALILEKQRDRRRFWTAQLDGRPLIDPGDVSAYSAWTAADRPEVGETVEPAENTTTEDADRCHWLHDVFPNPATVIAAEGYSGLSNEEASILLAYIEHLNEVAEITGLSLSRVASSIAPRLGLSAATIRRRIGSMARRFCGPPAALRIPRIESVRIRGNRRPRGYRTETTSFGSWSVTHGERITVETRAALHHAEKTVVGVSCGETPMYQLLARLLAHFTTAACPAAQAAEVPQADWHGNVEWATCRLAGKRGRRDPYALDYGEACHWLTRGMRPCGYCHAPILVGARLDGQLVTRARRFCGEACKKASLRRTARQRTGMSSP